MPNLAELPPRLRALALAALAVAALVAAPPTLRAQEPAASPDVRLERLEKALAETRAEPPPPAAPPTPPVSPRSSAGSRSSPPRSRS